MIMSARQSLRHRAPQRRPIPFKVEGLVKKLLRRSTGTCRNRETQAEIEPTRWDGHHIFRVKPTR